MEINKETLNSLEVGDFVKVKKADSTISEWKRVNELRHDWNGNVIGVQNNIDEFPYPVSSIVCIKKNISTHYIQPDPNSWIIGISERLVNPWRDAEFDWKKSQEKIQKAMNKDLISSIDCAIFKSITERMLETYKKKNADYGNSFDKSMNEFGLMSAVVRMSDKMERLKSLVKKDAKVKDESVEDTLLDLANYCIMTVMHLKINEDGK